MVKSVMMEKDALVALCSRPELHPGIVRLHYCFHDPVNLCALSQLMHEHTLILHMQTLC